jgi:hypothetical protein
MWQLWYYFLYEFNKINSNFNKMRYKILGCLEKEQEMNGSYNTARRKGAV